MEKRSVYANSSTVSIMNTSGEYRKRKSIFRKSTMKVHSGSSCDADVSNIDNDRDLTPGSLDVWLDLPEEIKHDPALAPFKKRYEQQHGKLESSVENEGDKTIFNKNIREISAANGETHHEAVVRLINPIPDKEKELKSTKRKTIEKTLRIVKLSALVGCWLLIMTSLLLNAEKRDVILHTAVSAAHVKEYDLQAVAADDRVKVLVTLTGPFEQNNNKNNNSGNVLRLWLQRSLNGSEEPQKSSQWKVQLASDEMIDFSTATTESKVLVLETRELGNGTDLDTMGNETTVRLLISTASKTAVPLSLTFQMNPLDPEDGLVYAVVLLLVLYILIIFEIINRTLAALLSSSLSISVLAWSGCRPSLGVLISWLHIETLLLLFSMMVLVAVLGETGLFHWLATQAVQITGGRTWPLINYLCFFTAIFSTFLDNVTTVLLMTPITIRLCEVMELNPVPVLMSMVIFSNVGGAATPVGDPPNVIIATHPAVLKEDINFTTFTVHMGLGILLVSIQTYLQIRYMYRDMSKLRHSVPKHILEKRQELAVWRRAAESLSAYSKDEDVVRGALEKKVEKLSSALAKREAKGGLSKSDPMFCSTLANMRNEFRITDKPLLIKSAVCLGFVVVVFFLHAFPALQRLSLGWTSLLGAMLLLLLSERDNLEAVLARVEWSTLLFFAALFVLMEALSQLGLIVWIGKFTESLILKVGPESRLTVALLLVLWVSGLASAFVDNIPLTTMMIRVIVSLSSPGGLALPLAPLAWALSFGACLGGNGTLIGASANVVCAGVAEQHGYRFTFIQFLRTGFPIMIGNLLVATAYLMICHVAFQWH